MIYLISLIILFGAELAYFKIADHYDIIDKPNHRSSHNEITIRGGGIVFPLSILVWFMFSGFQYPLFVGGLFLISFISFMDDLKDMSRLLRLVGHVLATALVFWALGLFAYSWLWLILIFFFFTGVINAYNFMDGINGITGVYSMVMFLTLLWINHYKIHFVDNDLLIFAIIGLIVFNFFNFRKKAICFAGDIGSIAMAFIICFLLVRLMLQTADVTYILLLAIYGVDVVCTIAIRLYRKENILQAHRSHLYQLLVNERKYQHLTVAVLYGIAQVVVNFAYFNTKGWEQYQVIGGFLLVLVFVYVVLRFRVNQTKLSKKPGL